MRPGLAPILLLALTVLAVACTRVPFDAPKSVSIAPPPSRSAGLGRAVLPWLDDPAGRSGFIALPSGTEALGARLRIIEEAEQTVDVQYFLIKPDLAGILIANSLLDAADRGVQVRFLIDDVFTSASDDQLAWLDRHPGIEVRIFNPMARKTPGALAFLSGYPRTNRRMHNKSLTADRAVTILGGRNIADEYFEIEQDVEFADFDLLAAGPVAAEVSATFNQFWNSAFSVPLAALRGEGDIPEDPDADDEIIRRAKVVYNNAMTSRVVQEITARTAGSTTAPSVVVTDPTTKLSAKRGIGYQVLMSEVRDRIDNAQREVIIISPYFVPGDDDAARLAALIRRGVRVTVITNSLASTNHAYVHGGYAPYRKSLLAAGVRLYEVNPDSVSKTLTGETAQLTMHTKAVLIDRRITFVGSLNFDPRSIELNTEMGVFIDSAQIGAAITDAVEADLPGFAYRVSLDAGGDLIWTYGSGETARAWSSDPGASAWRRIIAAIVSVLPVEGQL